MTGALLFKSSLSYKSIIMRRNNRNIPQLTSAIVVKHKYRFEFPGTTGLPPTNITFTCDDLIAVFGGVATTVGGGSATVRLAAKSFKIHSVEAWAPPPAVGESASLSLKWATNPGGGGPSVSSLMEVTDTTLSTASPLHIVTKPPKESLSAFWNQFGGGEVFEMSAPVNTVMDILITHVVDDSATALDTYTYSTSTATVTTYVWPKLVTSSVIPIAMNY